MAVGPMTAAARAAGVRWRGRRRRREEGVAERAAEETALGAAVWGWRAGFNLTHRPGAVTA